MENKARKKRRSFDPLDFVCFGLETELLDGSPTILSVLLTLGKEFFSVFWVGNWELGETGLEH